MKILLLVDDASHFAIESCIKPHLIDTTVDVLQLYKEPGKKKSSTAAIRQYINEELLSKCINYEYILCCNVDYFKVLTGERKAEANLGHIFKNHGLNIAYAPAVNSFFYDREKATDKLILSVNAIHKDILGLYKDPFDEISKHIQIIYNIEEFKKLTNDIIRKKVPFGYDLETYSLKHYKAGIASIAISLSKTEAYSFYIGAPNQEKSLYYIKFKTILKNLFNTKQNKSIAHNISYDAYILIYELYMKNLLDQEGLLRGLDAVLNNWDCTQLISYLATNTCSGNELSLKKQAQDYAGNYSLDEIKNIGNYSPHDICIYNGIDALNIWHVYEKNYPILIQDNQLDIYENIFKPSTKDIIQMQLTGIPVNISKAEEAAKQIDKDLQEIGEVIKSSNFIKDAEHILANEWAEKKNKTYKIKRVTNEDWPDRFNLNSSLHIRTLLYDVMNLPIIKKTNAGSPSTDKQTITHLINHTKDKKISELLANIHQYNLAAKIYSTYIPIFLNAQEAPDGWHYIFGSFKLGGTVSGRMSSSDPNLQNLPSGSYYGKLIKQIVQAPPGWVFVGPDFSSLEDVISALTTKDPNKLKVYTGHIIYEVCIDGTIHHVRDDAIINFDGKSYTGEEFYDTFGSL